MKEEIAMAQITVMMAAYNAEKGAMPDIRGHKAKTCAAPQADAARQKMGERR